LEVFDKNPHGETSHEIECTVVIHDIANPLAAGVDITAMSKTYSYDIDGPGHANPLAAGVDITAMSKTYSYDIDGPGHADPLAAGVDITAMSKTYSYDIDGPGHIAPHYFQDVQYLLKHARFIGEREVYETVTIFNYPQVRDLAIQMRADAVQILKDQFERLYLPSQLGLSLRNEQRLLSQYTKKEV